MSGNAWFETWVENLNQARQIPLDRRYGACPSEDLQGNTMGLPAEVAPGFEDASASVVLPPVGLLMSIAGLTSDSPCGGVPVARLLQPAFAAMRRARQIARIESAAR